MPDGIEPPYKYKRLVVYNVANVDMILNIVTTVLGLIFSCMNNNRVVQYILCLRIFQPVKFQYALKKLLNLFFMR